jgi:hypothetical protein
VFRNRTFFVFLLFRNGTGNLTERCFRHKRKTYRCSEILKPIKNMLSRGCDNLKSLVFMLSRGCETFKPVRNMLSQGCETLKPIRNMVSQGRETSKAAGMEVSLYRNILRIAKKL